MYKFCLESTGSDAKRDIKLGIYILGNNKCINFIYAIVAGIDPGNDCVNKDNRIFFYLN